MDHTLLPLQQFCGTRDLLVLLRCIVSLISYQNEVVGKVLEQSEFTRAKINRNISSGFRAWKGVTIPVTFRWTNELVRILGLSVGIQMKKIYFEVETKEYSCT